MPNATPAKGPPAHDKPLSLLPYDLFDLTDLFLNFPAYILVFSFGFQPGIHAEFSGDLLDLPLYFVKHTFRLVLRAGFHGVPPVGY